MKKALLIVLAIVAMCFLIANVDYLSDFFNTMLTGALVPMIIAIILMLARHFVQAASYDAAFEAVGHRTGFWHNVILIFSLVFINTFCLFSGATGVAFIIDDAHREGCDAGQSTGGAFLSQIGYFAAVFMISVIGFLTMWISGRMNTVFLIGGLLLAGVLVILSSMFFVGHFKPRILYRIFLLIEKILNKLLGIIHKSLKLGWGRNTAHSFIATSNLLAKNPKGTIITVAYASFSAILNMTCLIAIGYAFGFENVEALVAAFAVAAISVILSPTPQGIGVVEALIAGILTAYGCTVATAAAIALVYRGIMFWIPFCIGAVMLSQSGFFKSKKSAALEQKHKDIGWIAGTLVFIIGATNLVLILFPDALTPYTMLTSWIDMSSLLVGIPLMIASILLMVLAVGLVLRFRTAWAITISGLILFAGTEFLFKGTWQVAIVMVLLVLWMFWKREAFDRPFSVEAAKADIAAWRKRRAEARQKRAQDNQKEKRQAKIIAADETSEEQRLDAGGCGEPGGSDKASEQHEKRHHDGRHDGRGHRPSRVAAQTAANISPDSINLDDGLNSWQRQANRGRMIGEDVLRRNDIDPESL